MNRYEAVPYHPEADTFDFRRSWQTIKQAWQGHRLLILCTAAITLALVVTYIRVWPPVYAAEVLLVADAEEDIPRDTFYRSWNVFRKDHLADEVKMIVAAPVLKDVIDGMALEYDDVHHPFIDHATYLWTESWVGKHYRTIKNWVLSTPPNPYGPSPEDIDRARVVDGFRAGVVLKPYPETNVGRLIVLGPSPRVADMANTLASVYLERRRRRHAQEAHDAYRSLSGEVSKAHTELIDIERKIEAFHQDNNLLFALRKDDAQVDRWLDLKSTIVDLQAAVAAIKSRLANIDFQLQNEEQEVTQSQVFQSNSLYLSLRERLSQLQSARNEKLSRFRDDAPEVRDIDVQIESLRGQLAGEPEVTTFQRTRVVSEVFEMLRDQRSRLESELRGTEAELTVKLTAEAELRALLDVMPTRVKTNRELERARDLLERKYLALNEKLTVAAVSMATAVSAPPSMRIVESATAPAKPAWPKTKLLLMLAVLFGLGAGFVLALIIELLHGRVSRHRLRSAEAAFPVYAVVDRDRGDAARLFKLPNTGRWTDRNRR